MTERGRIREIRGELVIVALDKSPYGSASCFGCLKMECKSKGSIFSAQNPNALPLEIGQTVELKRPEASFLGQSITALLPPALGFLLGFFLTRLLFPGFSEGTAAFSGVIFLFTTAFIVYRVRKKIPAKECLRYVERVLA